MLKKRVIFTLLYDRGHFMLSRNFRLQKVGDLRWLQKNYNFSRIAFSIDELIVLDVSRGERDIGLFCDHIKSLTEGCFVPIAAGGGVRTLEHARILLRSGADKIVINTPLFGSQVLINELASEFGQQCVVASMDIKQTRGVDYQVWVDNGNRCIDEPLAACLEKVAHGAVGELYLNSMDRDGTGQGYDLRILDHLPKLIPKPIILGGGAGNLHHLAEGLLDIRVDAVATAHLFNFVGDGLEKAREGLKKNKFNLASWPLTY
jgi:cyclase